MDPTLRLVERFEELLQRKTDASPYDYQTIFPTGGFFVRRASQKKLALLKRIDEQLRTMLRPGERVAYLTSGVLHSFWESYFFGVPAYYLNRRALVLTTERLILIQIDSKNRPQQLKSQLYLSDIERLGSTGFGNAKLRLKSGKNFVFAYVPKRDRKQLSELMLSLRPRATARGEASGLEHLCPHCYTALPEHPEMCGACRGQLKSFKRAFLLSLLFPGLGTIYLGHWWFGGFKAVIGAMIWLAVLVPDPQNPMTPSERVLNAIIVLAIVHGAAALASFYLARKGHYPSGTRGAAAPAT